MIKWFCHAVFLFTVVPGVTSGQTKNINPIKTTICELLKTPEAFNGRIVSVHGRVGIAFEYFGLQAGDCLDKKIDLVWLEYGRGPKRQPTTWCCGDLTPRDSLRLMEDRSFREFHRYLTSQFKGKGCSEGECYSYEVTATLIGRLDAVPTVLCPDGRSQCPKDGGFGHFGVVPARLVIESVSDVVAQAIGPVTNAGKSKR